jgi:hypothetical protein
MPLGQSEWVQLEAQGKQTLHIKRKHTFQQKILLKTYNNYNILRMEY